MKLLTKLSFTCFLIVALIELVTAFRFLTAPAVMDYHQVAMGMEWAEFTPGMKAITLNFMRSAGVGFLIAGIAILSILAVPFRKGEPWARWALAAIILSQASVMGAIVLNVRHLTPANAPVAPFILFAVLAVLGFLLFRGKKTGSFHPTQGERR